MRIAGDRAGNAIQVQRQFANEQPLRNLGRRLPGAILAIGREAATAFMRQLLQLMAKALAALFPLGDEPRPVAGMLAEVILACFLVPFTFLFERFLLAFLRDGQTLVQAGLDGSEVAFLLLLQLGQQGLEGFVGLAEQLVAIEARCLDLGSGLGGRLFESLQIAMFALVALLAVTLLGLEQAATPQRPAVQI